MLYLLGAVAIDTAPFSIDRMERQASGSIAAKPIIGGRQRKENTGEGEDDITLTGQILPTRIGGLSELETLHEMRRKGTRFPLMRGDGFRFGWYVINKISEKHENILRNGVGFTVQHSVTMEQADMDAGDGQQVILGLLSLFGALGGL